MLVLKYLPMTQHKQTRRVTLFACLAEKTESMTFHHKT